MAKNVQEERMRWVLPIINKEIKLVDVIKICPHSERSLKRWLAAHRKHGPEGLVSKSTKPKTHPKETPIRLKEEIISLRKQTKLCAKKLHWRLQKQGLNIHERTIGKILKAEGLTRRYRVKKVKYKYIKVERQPGELVEIDIKYVPGRIGGKRYFQYTAVDTASHWRYLKAYTEQTNHHSILFLKEVIERFKYKVQAIKTDNGPMFTNRYLGVNNRSDFSFKTLHALDEFCSKHNITHFLIDPGKPAQNGTVERSHREDQEKFYDRNKFKSFADLQKKMQIWNEEYNNLEHCSLNGKTPNEMLESFQVTNVCA